jgi:RNA polymerase sigma-70 factor (ECF subfamily)
MIDPASCMGRDGAASPEDHAAMVAAVAERRDRTAFARLFDYYAPRVHAYLLRLRLDPVVADELTQEVMTTLWQKAALFDRSKSSVATWLFRIARNRRIDAHRRVRDEPPIDGAILDIPDPEQMPDDRVDAAQRDRMVRSALDLLPVEQLELVRLAFFDGHSHSEIAELTGLPLGTVKSRLRLAFSRLRRALDDEGIGG